MDNTDNKEDIVKLKGRIYVDIKFLNTNNNNIGNLQLCLLNNLDNIYTKLVKLESHNITFKQSKLSNIRKAYELILIPNFDVNLIYQIVTINNYAKNYNENGRMIESVKLYMALQNIAILKKT